jgi:DNA-binding CsgD family transcriptional regulator
MDTEVADFLVFCRVERRLAELTCKASELTVARLVAEGLTNREVAERLFVSPHTVNSHLRHAFSKLGISSRVELARVVRDYEIA